jgi:hypothetical protein
MSTLMFNEKLKMACELARSKDTPGLDLPGSLDNFSWHCCRG